MKLIINQLQFYFTLEIIHLKFFIRILFLLSRINNFVTTLSLKKLIIRAIYREVELVKIVRVKGESNEMMGRDRLSTTTRSKRNEMILRGETVGQISFHCLLLCWPSVHGQTRDNILDC